MKFYVNITCFFIFTFSGSIAQAGWVFAYEDSVTIETKDHHCSAPCKSESTRTTYRIQLIADKGMRVRKPILKCIAGPCGGWNSIENVRITKRGTKAVGTFKVWSKPTTWVLTVKIYEKD